MTRLPLAELIYTFAQLFADRFCQEDYYQRPGKIPAEPGLKPNIT